MGVYAIATKSNRSFGDRFFRRLHASTVQTGILKKRIERSGYCAEKYGFANTKGEVHSCKICPRNRFFEIARLTWLLNHSPNEGIMLITFKSKAAAEVTMYQEHSNRILDLWNKDHNRGVLTAAEMGLALKKLEAEIAESKIHSASEEIQRDVHAHHSETHDDTEHEVAEPVSFATRAFPLLEMLKAAHKGQYDVIWGV